MSDRVPVTLLTGFLGSGKTTLLAKLVRSAAMKDAAVIVNEFGEIGLDHLLIERGREDVVLLDSGCLCCAVNDGLAETLEDLHYRRLRAEIPRFSRVVIETSGLADPAPIMHLLLADPAITRWYVLDGVVTTVDTLLGGQQLEQHEVSRRQAAVADVLVITKTDLGDAHALAGLESRLTSLNPRARRVRAVHGHLSAEQLTCLGPDQAAARPDEVTRWLTPDEAQLHVTHQHPHDIATFTLALHEPVTWSEYAEWLDALRVLPAEKLLRTKGVIALGDGGEPHVVQGVQHVFSHPARMAEWPWADHISRLVFIVQDLMPTAVEATLPRHPPVLVSGVANP